MKLPKSVRLYGIEHKIKQDKTSNGGCRYGEKERFFLRIGTRDKDRILQIFLHEVIEIILWENHTRFSGPHINPDNGDYIFVFDHNQFENMMAQIAEAIRPIVKE